MTARGWYRLSACLNFIAAIALLIIPFRHPLSHLEAAIIGMASGFLLYDGRQRWSQLPYRDILQALQAMSAKP